MKIYLVRHGDSVVEGKDNERPLSEKGKADIQHLANFISSQLQVTRIVHSEKFRAKQTAEIIASSRNATNLMEISPDLDPNSSVVPIIEKISKWNDNIMLVGHMPFMGMLAGKLITGNEMKNIVSFKTGTMLCLEQVEEGQWIICWMLNPEILRSMNAL